MTDVLRAIDRRCAELMGKRGYYYGVNSDNYAYKFTTRPEYANLLIEDLRKRNHLFTIEFERGGIMVYENWDDGIEVSGDTWMLAVARFYIAVRSAAEAVFERVESPPFPWTGPSGDTYQLNPEGNVYSNAPEADKSIPSEDFAGLAERLAKQARLNGDGCPCYCDGPCTTDWGSDTEETFAKQAALNEGDA